MLAPMPIVIHFSIVVTPSVPLVEKAVSSLVCFRIGKHILLTLAKVDGSVTLSLAAGLLSCSNRGKPMNSSKKPPRPLLSEGGCLPLFFVDHMDGVPEDGFCCFQPHLAQSRMRVNR